MKKLMILPILFPIVFVILFGTTTHAIAGAALTDFSRKGSKVSLTIAAWSEAEGVPNPCYGYRSCYIGPDVKYSSYGIGGLSGSCDAGACIRAEDLATLADVARRYKSQHPLPYSVAFAIDHLEDTSSCIGMVYIDHPSWSGHSTLLPGSVCTTIPPDNSRCEIDVPPYINHGDLSARDINGNTASVTGSVICNFGGQAIVTTSADEGSDIIYLNGTNLVSKLQVNGQNAASGIILNISANQPYPLTFTSTLESKSVIAAGKYSGAALVYVNYI